MCSVRSSDELRIRRSEAIDPSWVLLAVTAWHVALVGNQFDLEELPKLFRAPEAAVVVDDGGFFLKSSTFEEFDSAAEVRSEAAELLVRINGAARLAFPSFEPVSVGHVYRKNEAGKEIYVYEEASVRSREKATAVIVSGTGERKEVEPAALDAWVACAKRDRVVNKVLRLLASRDIGWDELYKVLEVVEDDAASDLIGSTQIPKSEISRFTQTANSYLALGDAARHAHEKVRPPPNPMTLNEAKNLILSLARAWVQRKTS